MHTASNCGIRKCIVSLIMTHTVSLRGKRSLYSVFVLQAALGLLQNSTVFTLVARCHPTHGLLGFPVGHGPHEGQTHHDDPRPPRRALLLGHGLHVGKLAIPTHGLHGCPTRCAKQAKHFLKHEERLGRRTIKTGATFPMGSVLSELQSELSTRVNHSPTA